MPARAAFPARHRAEPHGASRSGRLGGEATRRAGVVGIVPGEAPIARPTGAVLPERNGERRADRRHVRLGAVAGLPAPAAGPGPAPIPPRAA